MFFFKDAVSFSRFEWSVSKLSPWSIDNIALCFQFNSMTFLTMVNDINMTDVRCLEVCNGEMSPSSAVMGDRATQS